MTWNLEQDPGGKEEDEGDQRATIKSPSFPSLAEELDCRSGDKTVKLFVATGGAALEHGEDIHVFLVSGRFSNA